jgi:hypothetical protein
VYDDIHASSKTSAPVELKLTLRYVCPDSPYMTAEHTALAQDALDEAARKCFVVLGSVCDERFFIDLGIRLDHSNKGSTAGAQKA